MSTSQQAVADSADTIADVIDGETTVKVLRIRDGAVDLLPRNLR
ncbi:hypothetical protein [Micromonospora sp. Llam0]|nr:hypothetical protein [Micromonospora sp. Llam0]